MPNIGLRHCALSFSDLVQTAIDLVVQVQSMRIANPSGGYSRLSSRHQEIFADLALLKIHTAWESFLEDAFIRYMCGASSPGGYIPVLVQPRKATISVAINELLALAGRQPYLSWTTRVTINRANTYFMNGEPFTTSLNAVSQTVEEITAVRNSFAHRSAYAKSEFHNVVRRVYGYIPRGISPGRFLLSRHPSPAVGGLKFIEYYANNLLGSSASIIP